MKFAVSGDLKLTEVLGVPYRKYVELANSKSQIAKRNSQFTINRPNKTTNPKRIFDSLL
jgi:hypothetical protein